MHQESAVVLLSGGIDSAVACAMARARGFNVRALSFHYGQRHVIELTAAHRVAQALEVREHRIVEFDLRPFGASALTTDEIDVPKSDSIAGIGTTIPVTYVPARNLVFLSFGLAYAEVSGARDVFIGANAIDYSGYPDCRPAFIHAFEQLARLATKAGVEGASFRVQAPLLSMTKAQIIREGIRLGVDFSLTHSCYDPSQDGLACAHCDSCLIRRQGFAEAGAEDPARYRS